jgi:hypothetical protein
MCSGRSRVLRFRRLRGGKAALIMVYHVKHDLQGFLPPGASGEALSFGLRPTHQAERMGLDSLGQPPARRQPLQHGIQ